MNCEILHTIYVKSNGDIPCSCNYYGEQVLLGKIIHDDPLWDIQTVLTNDKYTHIRNSLSSGTPPWEDICKKCAFLRNNYPFSDSLSQREIMKIQIEPSLACNLDCPCCSSKAQRLSRPKPHLMKREVFESLFKSLTQHLYLVQSIEYQGQGEPLMHPQFAEFVKIARRYYPDAMQRLITNGNFDYWNTTNGEFIEEIYVSCDGAYQSSYERYRIKGNVEKAIKFMKDIKKAGMVRQLTWKYILFEFNDSDEELIAAQHLANNIGVDLLMFVFTHSKFKSLKYKPETVADLPIIYPNVITNYTTPIEKTYKNRGNYILNLSGIKQLLKKY